jgi:hypothetical protein
MKAKVTPMTPRVCDRLTLRNIAPFQEDWLRKGYAPEGAESVSQCEFYCTTQTTV